VPKLTALWSILIELAIPRSPFRLIIGDCSGGLYHTAGAHPLEVVPVLNYEHGEKIDLFLKKVCRGDYIVISDDDVFWLDELPWDWAINQLEKDSHVAVVSLMPRANVSSVLQGKIDQPMGSHCLVLRREIWLQEDLSFRVVYPPSTERYDWFYDTGDYANLLLLRRGYKIIIAPPEIRAHLVAFDGTSTWTLKIQAKLGNIMEGLIGIPIRQEKALRTIMVLQALTNLLAKYPRRGENSQLVDASVLLRAQNICETLMEKSKVHEIRHEVENKFIKIRMKLPSPNQTLYSRRFH
jgi:hypothetical protein